MLSRYNIPNLNLIKFLSSFGSVSVRDTAPYNLNDNKWHSVTVGRPGKYKHTLLIDDQHLATANTKGDDSNLHLDLDGILFLGKNISVILLRVCVWYLFENSFM